MPFSQELPIGYYLERQQGQTDQVEFWGYAFEQVQWYVLYTHEKKSGYWFSKEFLTREFSRWHVWIQALKAYLPFTSTYHDVEKQRSFNDSCVQIISRTITVRKCLEQRSVQHYPSSPVCVSSLILINLHGAPPPKGKFILANERCET